MAEVEEIETLSERQENELQALMSIFGTDDVKDLREKDPWKILRPPEILISLLPPDSMHGQEAFVSVNLMVKMPAKYPELVPDLELTNAKGLSNQLLSRLKQELQEEARKLCGEVMILDLCQHIQDFLHIHNKPPFKSFYEEMMSNQKKEREKIAQEQQRKLAIKKKKEEKQFLQIQEEIQKRQDALKEETRRIRNEAKQHGEGRLSMSEPSTPSSDSLVSPIAKDTEQKARSRSSKSPEDQRTPARQTAAAQSGSYHKNERRRLVLGRTSTPRCDEDQQDNSSRECTSHRGTHNITFTNKKERTICRGRCIGHSTRGSTMYVGIDIQSGELVAVAEWVLRWRHPSRKLDLDDKIKDENTASKYLKQLVGVEQELFSLAKLKHIHLIKYLAMHYTKDTCKITVHVLMEYAGGGNLNTCLQKNQCVPLEQLRLYTQQLLEALVYLHSKSIVHKDLKSSSVLLDTTGNIRLADYSLNKRLEELYCSVESNRPGVHFAEAKSGTKTSKKDDIYKLGMLVLSLAEGEALTGEVPSVPTSFPAELKDFLEKCLVLDETQRWSANQLLDHTYLKTPIYSKVGTTSKQQSQHTNKNTDGAGDEEEEEEDTDIPFIPRSDSGHSRLKNEFDILKWLGKGGFGDVIKVRNKLDGRYYAIKRIPLNTRSKQFTKKITREVKLLSRLNNENVVRYYNSWIETSDEPAPSDSSATFTDTTSQSKTPSRSSSANEVKQKSVLFHNSLGFVDDIEMNVPAAVEDSIEWSVSISNRDPQLEDDSSSDIDNDDDDDDEEDVFGASFMPYGDSDSGDGIVFEQKSKFEWSQSEDIKEKLSLTAESDHNHKDESTVEARPRLQFLYIQMEFCEKSTLRSCIDMGLYQDPDRVWRFFREIVEGLVHIHEQGMIHRDLKPVNIFMDSNDHVKIGDFGLATTEIISKQQTSLLDLKMNLDKSASMDMRVSSSKSLSMEDSELTGKVGSALYVSPEMLITSTRAHYNQKVDIYSLGVMFFEMCYRPLTTGMERVKILSNIRLPTVDFPEDFDEIELPNQAAIVRWMLNHDPNCRPTAQELLQSELLPPAQMEEAELTEVLRSTIADPNSRSYRHMVNTVLSQPLNPATDFTFDMDLHRGSFHQATHLLQMQVVNTVEKIFRYHSGIRISSPLLMPKSILYEHTDQYVCLMDQSGGLVALPYDLRVPFARYIARNNLNHVKRYNIERVYRQKKLYGLHPRELTECAFDIITNTPTSGLSEAELIQIVNEILMEYPVLQNRNYYIRLNHVSLLKSVLLHCGVPDELHQHVLAILGDTKLEKQGRLQLQTKLCSLSLSDQTIINLYHFIETEGSFGKIASMLRCITKGRGQSAGLAKKALKEMEEIISHAENLGCKLEVTLAIGMVYNIHMWSGVIFQIAANVRRKKKPVMDVLAAGGRYDSLIGAFQRPSSFGTQQSLQPVAAGVSISLDKLTTVVSEDQELQVAGACEALVCSLGNRPSIKDKLQVARSLWAAGICTDIFQDITQSQEEIQDYCRKASIPHLVLLKDLEADTIKVRSFEKEAGKVTEKKLTSINAVIDHIKQALLQAKMDQCELGSASNNKAPSVTSQSSNEGQTSSTSHHTSSNVPSYNVTFLMSDTNKLASNVKRRYESQIYANISSALTHISSRAKVEVIGMEFSAAVLRTIAAYLEVNFDEYAFETSISNIVEKHTRHKKYFIKIFDHIHDLKFTKKCPVILLYGLKDDSYKILL